MYTIIKKHIKLDDNLSLATSLTLASLMVSTSVMAQLPAPDALADSLVDVQVQSKTGLGKSVGISVSNNGPVPLLPQVEIYSDKDPEVPVAFAVFADSRQANKYFMVMPGNKVDAYWNVDAQAKIQTEEVEGKLRRRRDVQDANQTPINPYMPYGMPIYGMPVMTMPIMAMSVMSMPVMPMPTMMGTPFMGMPSTYMPNYGMPGYDMSGMGIPGTYIPPTGYSMSGYPGYSMTPDNERRGFFGSRRDRGIFIDRRNSSSHPGYSYQEERSGPVRNLLGFGKVLVDDSTSQTASKTSSDSQMSNTLLSGTYTVKVSDLYAGLVALKQFIVQ